MKAALAAAAATLAAGLAVAIAQDETADPFLEELNTTAPQMHEPEIERGLGSPPASELDALSQGGADDPFPMMENRARRQGVSVTIRALNKIVARYVDIAAPIGEVAKFGSLEIVPRYCDKRPPEDFPETTAFLEVFDRDLARARTASSVQARDISGGRPVAVAVSTAPTDAKASAADLDRIFSGWMFASSPGLNPLEHSVYDVWVIDCKTVTLDE